MAGTSGYTVTPHHRQNRRRERPGSRTRRTITRKSNIQYECSEGLLDAHDLTVPLPSDKLRASPLLRQNFDQSWQRWKARQAEEQASAEMDKLQSEQDKLRLFGGEIDEDELYRMGILYDDGDITAQDAKSNTVSCDVPSERSVPMFVFRHGKPRRVKRRSISLHSLPLYLSFAGLSDDADISRLLSPSLLHKSGFPHRITIKSPPIPTEVPQSLPPTTPALTSVSDSPSLLNNDITSLPLDSNSGDWTLVATPYSTADIPTPLSDPETWILIDDS